MSLPSPRFIALGGALGFLVGVILTVVLASGGSGADAGTIASTQRSAPPRTAPAPAPKPKPAGPVVPNLVGHPLDQAKDEVSDASFAAQVEGGGVFGVVIESNWQVVEQYPAAGTPLRAGSSVTLRVERI